MQPRIIIRPEVHQEIMYYVNNTPYEVSGLGRVKPHPNGDIEVVKCYLLKQEGSAAMTDLDPEAVADLMYTSREDDGLLNWWWHSHVKMKVFMSGTDVPTIQQLGKRGHFYATVFNQHNDMYSAYYQGCTDERPAIYIDDLITTIGSSVSTEKEDMWQQNLDHLVTKSVPKFDNFPHTGRCWPSPSAVDHEGMAMGLSHRDRPRDVKGNMLPKVKNAVKNRAPDNEADFAALLDSYISSPVDYARWAEACCWMNDTPTPELTYHALWNFYELWDGNLEEVELMSVNEAAERDADVPQTMLGGMA